MVTMTLSHLTVLLHSVTLTSLLVLLLRGVQERLLGGQVGVWAQTHCCSCVTHLLAWAAAAPRLGGAGRFPSLRHFIIRLT